MANVDCKYTYYPVISGQPIRGSTQCAETPETYIHVPQASSLSEFQFRGTTVTINYNLRNPPPGGIEITKAVISFNYELDGKGRIGFGTNYAASTEFPNVDITGSLYGSYEYEVQGLINSTNQTFSITFWPYDIDKNIIISYINVNIYYKSLIIDNSIAAPTEIEIYNRYYNRAAVRWNPPSSISTEDIHHYSVSIYAGAHDRSLLPSSTDTLVSLGWVDTSHTAAIIPLASFIGTAVYEEMNDTPYIYAKVRVVLKTNRVGSEGSSLNATDPSYQYASFLYIDTLEDDTQNHMFEREDMIKAYELCRSFLAHVNRISLTGYEIERFMESINQTEWNPNLPIKQKFYDNIMHHLQTGNENYEIPDDTNQFITPMTRSQWRLLLERL